MSQVLQTAAPYDDVERDELRGYMLDEAKVVGQSVCSLQHCSDGAAAPFLIDAPGALGTGAYVAHRVGASIGTVAGFGMPSVGASAGFTERPPAVYALGQAL